MCMQCGINLHCIGLYEIKTCFHNGGMGRHSLVHLWKEQVAVNVVPIRCCWPSTSMNWILN